MARLMAEAPVQVQNTCSRSCSACVSRDEAAACCQPHGKSVPRFVHSSFIMGQSWPPAPPHHAGASAIKLPSSYSPIEVSIPGVLVLGAPLLWPGLWGAGLPAAE
jgi:hypothetical protein